MRSKLMERRDFLKKAAQGALAVPMAAMMPGAGEAQEVKKAAMHAAPAHKVATPAGPKVTLNVRDLGATGDGKTKDTLALQQTIERCSRLGGGEGVVPAGGLFARALGAFHCGNQPGAR